MKRYSLLWAIISILILTSGCSNEPAQISAPTIDAMAIHTQVAATLYAANPSPTLTPPLPAQVEEPSTQTQQVTTTPEVTITTEVITVPTMANVPRLPGYNTYGIRVLEQPAAVVRDGITLAVEQVIVFSDHIELVYTVRDIPHAVLYDPFTEDPAYSCSGPASYPNLVLPDGSVIYPENYLLDGKALGTMEDFASSYLIHIYQTAVPDKVRALKLVLDCLELAHIQRAPRNWEVPFQIVPLN